MNRISLLYKMDGLLNNCKQCERPDAAPEKKCKGCEIYTQLREIGTQLEAKKQMPKITVDEYRDLKAQGITDTQIAIKKDIAPSYLSALKKKWFKDTVKPVVKAVKEERAMSTKSEKEAELRDLVSELSDKLDAEKKKIAELEAKAKETEHITAACSDVEEEINELQLKLEHERKAKEWAQDEYARARSSLVKTDAELENHKQWLKTAGEELNRLQKENKHLWALIGIKAAEMNG